MQGINAEIREKVNIREVYRYLGYGTKQPDCAVEKLICEVLDELMPEVDAYVTSEVRKNLMNLSQNYFAQQEKAVQAIESKLDELEQKLGTLKYE